MSTPAQCRLGEQRLEVDVRWGFRVASETDHIVPRKASPANTTRTVFVVDAAVTEAEHVLAGRSQFALDPMERGPYGIREQPTKSMCFSV